MVTLALRRSRFSSCSALHLSLNVSSSILRTLFSCCSEARRFVSSSKRNCEMTMLGFPEFEADEDIGVAELLPAPSVSLSLALSAMAVPQCGAETELQRTAQWYTVRSCSRSRHSAPSRMAPVLQWTCAWQKGVSSHLLQKQTFIILTGQLCDNK